MKNLITVLVGLLVVFAAFSQDNPFVLHPLVGDTITKAEKIRFVLFPEISDDNFLQGTLVPSSDGYVLHYETPANERITRQFSESEINQTRINLDKLNAYYNGHSKSDTLKDKVKSVVQIKNVDEEKMNKDLISNETKNKIEKEAIMHTRMKEDAERLDQIKRGNDITGGGYIELFGKKKRKK
jgi:hypothetical protein